VRAVWCEPAFTEDDEGKQVTIIGESVKVDNETRRVEWTDSSPPEGVLNATITSVWEWGNAGDVPPHIVLDNDRCVSIPPIAGSGKTIDLAFAEIMSSPAEGGGDARINTKFFTPVVDRGSEVTTQLMDARQVEFGQKKFSHFL